MAGLLGAIDELHEIIGIGSVIVVSLLGLGLGRGAERSATAVLLADAFGLALLSGVFDHADRVVLVHAKAVAVLAAYGLLLLRWPRRWLVLLTGLQAFAVLLHLVAWLDRSIVIPANALLLNGIGWSMLLVLAAASIGEAFRRHDARAAPPDRFRVGARPPRDS